MCWALSAVVWHVMAKDCTWNFPLQDYIPKRDNHNVPDVQADRDRNLKSLLVVLRADSESHSTILVLATPAFCILALCWWPVPKARRFWDNNVVHMGLNAEELGVGCRFERELPCKLWHVAPKEKTRVVSVC